jgi:hypothetical protein
VCAPAALLSPDFDPGVVLDAGPGGLRRRVVDADAVAGVPLDVVAGVYEGGAKVWECTRDLLAYLAAGGGDGGGGGGPLIRAGSVVADVGCGAGLLGVAALLAGAARCLFCDMNAAVLQAVTAPNVAVNLGGAALGRCTLLAGPWGAMAPAAARARGAGVGVAAVGAGAAGGADVAGAGAVASATAAATSTAVAIETAPAATTTTAAADGSAPTAGCAPDGDAGSALAGYAGRVDVLLASEVLYNTDHYDDLCALIALLLTPHTGVALVATKRFYYGVGGGTDAFLAVARSGRHALAAARVATWQDGASMVRDLLELRVPGGDGGGAPTAAPR